MIKKEENLENVETIRKAIKEIGDNVRGLKRETAMFFMSFDDDLTLIIRSRDGLQVSYPMLMDNSVDVKISKPWYYLSTWMAKWDESAQKAVEGFLGYILYPTAMALSFDEQYIDDIKNASASAIKRDIERIEEAGAYEEQEES